MFNSHVPSSQLSEEELLIIQEFQIQNHKSPERLEADRRYYEQVEKWFEKYGNPTAFFLDSKNRTLRPKNWEVSEVLQIITKLCFRHKNGKKKKQSTRFNLLWCKLPGKKLYFVPLDQLSATSSSINNQQILIDGDGFIVSMNERTGKILKLFSNQHTTEKEQLCALLQLVRFKQKSPGFRFETQIIPVNSLKDHILFGKTQIPVNTLYAAESEFFGLYEIPVATKDGTVLTNWEAVLAAKHNSLREMEVKVAVNISKDYLLRLVAWGAIFRKSDRVTRYNYIVALEDYLRNNPVGQEWCKSLGTNVLLVMEQLLMMDCETIKLLKRIANESVAAGKSETHYLERPIALSRIIPHIRQEKERERVSEIRRLSNQAVPEPLLESPKEKPEEETPPPLPVIQQLEFVGGVMHVEIDGIALAYDEFNGYKLTSDTSDDYFLTFRVANSDSYCKVSLFNVPKQE